MPKTRIAFQSFTLIEDEDAGSTNMAIYATLTDPANSTIGSFRWNNRGIQVDEVRGFPLTSDLGNPPFIDIDLNTFATLTIRAFASDDTWPDDGNKENDLGTVMLTFDPRVPASLGSFVLGPSSTDNGNAGYLVQLRVLVVPDVPVQRARLEFKNLVLYEDEEGGSTNMAIYVRAQGPGIDQELFRWNNAGNKVDEVASYALDNAPTPVTMDLTLTGPTMIHVDGYAQDGSDWPNPGDNENWLGAASIIIDPADPETEGEIQIGPTTTDSGNEGYLVNLSVDYLPANPTPDLSVVGVEVTQVIQHFQSALGGDNTVPLVDSKLALVRCYLDSGIDPSINGGKVANVTGTLNATGSAVFALAPIAPMTAQPAANVNRATFTDTLNFLIPAAQAHGTLTLTAEATVGANVSNPFSVTVTFRPVGQLQILMVRVQSSAVSAPTRQQYFAALNQLPLVYPIPTDPAVAIQFQIVDGSEIVTVGVNQLSTQSGMEDLLDTLEDIQEDSDDDNKKVYALVPGGPSSGISMARFGISRPGDNVALGWSFIMESVGHELGHVYGLAHAPCGSPAPADPDPNFVPGGGLVGEVGVDPVALNAFPITSADLMSYCGDRGATATEGCWISAYDYLKLFNRFA
jgi:hypothetical protein